MAWENGGRYYVRKVWQGGTCRSEYIGAGPTAPLIARLDAIEREEWEEKRRELRREQAEEDAINAQIDELGERVQDLVTAALIVVGCHTHKRQWRRARGNGIAAQG